MHLGVKSCAAAFVVIGAPAFAAAEPVVAPRGDWVEQVSLPTPDPGLAKAPVQLLLLNSQSRFGDSTHEFYVESATLVQTPEGLGGVGTIALPWHPDQSDLIVHQVAVVRGGKTVDLLAGGAKFTTLRRENNLERAMLDGTLTAVMQPEGLSVGDTLLLSYTVRMKPGSVRFEPEHMAFVPVGLPVRRVRYREVWPETAKIQWRASPALGAPKLRKTRLGNELVVELSDVKPSLPPARAPARYRVPPNLQLSGYSDWSSVSRIFAPLYQAGAALQPSSPLKAEIARIATAHSDPRGRALASLRLVQDQIRYVALGMGEGGYTPASADQTWSRKFGDCKGKTVTLLALLEGLGVEAEPVLVSTTFRDAVGDQLPQMRLFDHVLVRAKIGEKTYLLDGTRSGDRSLDALGATSFGYGLPLRTAGASLDKLPVEPPAEPLTELDVTYDASSGLVGPVPVTSRIVFKGELALAYRLAAAQIGKEQLEKAIRAEYGEIVEAPEGSAFEFQADDDRNSFSATFRGKAAMDWLEAPGRRANRYQFSDYVISWDSDFKRDPGPGQDAPFELAFPTFITGRETIILPKNGAGFRIEGKSLQSEIAGTLIKRDLSLNGDRAVALSSFRRLRNEVSAAEAKTAQAKIKALESDAAYLRSPDDYRPSRAELDSLVNEDPKDASAYLERGYQLMRKGQNKSALADFKQAALLDPKNARAHSNQGIAQFHLGKLDEAEAALRTSLALDADDFVVHQGLGLVHARLDQLDKAVAAFSRSLELDPDNSFTIAQRMGVQAGLGRYELAIADADRLLALAPNDPVALTHKAHLALKLGDRPTVLALVDTIGKLEADAVGGQLESARLLTALGMKAEAEAAHRRALAALDAAPESSMNAEGKDRVRAELLLESGKPGEAIALLDKMLAKQPFNPALLNGRCWTRALANLELGKALADCDKALSSQPDNAPALDSRGFVKLRRGEWDAAIADFKQAIELQPQMAAPYYGRGLAKLRKGDRAGAEADLAQARRLSLDVDRRFAPWGLTVEPQSTGVAKSTG